MESRSQSSETSLVRTRPHRLGLWRRGDPFLWLTGGAVALSLLMILGLLGLVGVNGLRYFLVRPVVELELVDGSKRMGELRDREPIPHAEGFRVQIKQGNRDLYGMDHVWISEAEIVAQNRPLEAVVVERWEWGNFYGRVRAVLRGEERQPILFPKGEEVFREVLAFGQRIQERKDRLEDQIAKLNRQIAARQRRIRSIQYRQGERPEARARIEAIQAEIGRIQGEYQRQAQVLEALLAEGESVRLELESVDGQRIELPTYRVVRLYRPNVLNFWQRGRITLSKVGEFLFDEPREANTEGGVFPAIFGTVTLVLLMSIFVVPLGVVAAVYLREYARQGTVIRLIRIAVNNLAGVPSIVYGVFGVGFFIYTVGGTIDRWFYPEFLPTPTWGSGAILWASLTLALLTLPVVIVSTEEALAAVPRSWREASLSLGATQFQTLVRVLLPATTPGILTGLILAVARAAGEVAPLMITGAVKLAPTLPIDSEFPYFHFNRSSCILASTSTTSAFNRPTLRRPSRWSTRRRSC